MPPEVMSDILGSLPVAVYGIDHSMVIPVGGELAAPGLLASFWPD
jgi:hypothetical protein